VGDDLIYFTVGAPTRIPRPGWEAIPAWPIWCQQHTGCGHIPTGGGEIAGDRGGTGRFVW